MENEKPKGPPCTCCGVQTSGQTKTGLCGGCYIAFRLPGNRIPQSKLLEARSAVREARARALADES